MNRCSSLTSLGGSRWALISRCLHGNIFNPTLATLKYERLEIHAYLHLEISDETGAHTIRKSAQNQDSVMAARMDKGKLSRGTCSPEKRDSVRST